MLDVKTVDFWNLVFQCHLNICNVWLLKSLLGSRITILNLLPSSNLFHSLLIWMVFLSLFCILQSRTDRIVFKLFGKQPSDFPGSLRGQVSFRIDYSVTRLLSLSVSGYENDSFTLFWVLTTSLEPLDSWLVISQSYWHWELH